MTIPVNLSDAKYQLQVGWDDVDRDAEIAGFIADAAAWVEEYTGHILDARDVTEQFTGFDRLHLRAWPIKPGAVPIVIYANEAGQAIAVTAVRTVVTSRPARMALWAGSRWPTAPGAAVSITVRAGYETGDTVPGNIRRAMLVLISAYDADREGGEIFAKAEETARGLCSRLKVRSL